MTKAQRIAADSASSIKKSIDGISSGIKSAFAAIGVGISLKGIYDLVDGVAQAAVSMD